MANIFEKVRAERKQDKFVKDVQSVAGLVETLSGPGPFTIFVPTDEAFDQLSGDQQVNLLNDPGKLAKVMKYHVVPGLYTSDNLLDYVFLKTLDGLHVKVWTNIQETPLGEAEVDTGGDALNYIARNTVVTAVRKSIKINGAHILQADVRADNGIMHVIDKVLVPPFTSV